MRFYNLLDEQNRFNGLLAAPQEPNSQVNSHGISYLAARKMLQHSGREMGLDRILGHNQTIYLEEETQ